MKKFLLLALGLALLCLTACSQWFREDYQSITPHVEQTISTTQMWEEDQTPVVSNRIELRGAVLGFIRDWTENGIINVENYDGNLSADLSETMEYATKEDPVGAYAVDFADAELKGDGRRGRITLSVVFRRSAAEINSIVTVNGNNSAYMKIQSTLSAYGTALTLRIKNYQETDFSAYIRNYCLENPGQVVCLPEISAAVYPEEGETRILELHFTYPGTREEMREKQSSLNTILTSAASYIRSGETEMEKAALLYRFLSSRFDYTPAAEEPSMPAYDLLCEGVAHSLSFASVFYSECDAAGVNCWLVRGNRDGTAYYWNLLRVGEEYYFVDILRNLERGAEELELLTADALIEEGYVWEQADYPTVRFEGAEPTATTEPTEVVEPSSAPTEEPSAPPENTTAADETEEALRIAFVPGDGKLLVFV